MRFTPFRTVGLVSVILLIASVQVLYDPVSSARHSMMVMNVRTELPQARARWEALGVTGYRFEIQGDARSICRPSATIEVRNGFVVKVETKGKGAGRILPPESWSDPDWGEEVFLCSYHHFTMPQFFTLIEETLQNYAFSVMQADFDPQYGFVSDFKFGIYVGYGLLRPKLGNCCYEFQIKNFQPLFDIQ